MNISADTKTKPIRASLKVWGSNPNGQGTTYAEIVPVPQIGGLIYAGGTALEGREQLGETTSINHWRERLEALLAMAWPCHEDHDPSEVRVTGARGLEAAMLRLFWSGPAGANAVRELMALPDDALLALDKAMGLASPDCADLVEYAQDNLEDISMLIAVLTGALVAGASSWDDVRDQVDKQIDQQERRDEQEDAALQAKLAPFKIKIDTLLASWWRQSGGASSSATQMMMTAKQSALARWLEHFVVTHHEFPIGSHRIEVRALGQHLFLDVDFDVLAS